MKSTGSHRIASIGRGRRKALLFLAGILGTLLPTALFPAEDVCTYFEEDFSGTSGKTWTSLHGHWYIQNGKLNVDSVEAGTMAHDQTDFFVADFFNLDVDVELVTASHNNAAFGLFPYNSGDVFFDINGRTLSGVGAIVYPNLGIARLLGWDVEAQQWYQSDDFPLPASLSSIGVSCSPDAFTLRINGQNTSTSFSGNFSYSYQVLDKLWLFAQESGTHVRFDNVCAGPLGGTVPPIPTQYLLTVNKSGTGSGIVTSSPTGIDCGTDCSETLDEGATVTLTAAPNSGSTFAGWSGGPCTGTEACTIIMEAAINIVANFDKALPTNLVPLPEKQQSFNFDAVASPVLSFDASQAKPIGLGSVAEGGDVFNLVIGLNRFAGPVDIYLAIYLPSIDPGHFYIFNPDGTLKPLIAGNDLVAWQTSVENDINISLFGQGVPLWTLPTGIYNFYLLVSPHQSLSVFYFWATAVTISPTGLDPGANGKIREFSGVPFPEPLPPPPPTMDASLVINPQLANSIAKHKQNSDQYAKLEIVDVAMDWEPSGDGACWFYTKKPKITIKNSGNIANGEADVWQVKYSAWYCYYGMWFPNPPELRPQIGSIKAGRPYPPFVIEPGETRTFEGTSPMVNIMPIAIRWDLYRQSTEFEGKWELMDTVVREFDMPGPNLRFVSAKMVTDVGEPGEPSKVGIWIKNIGDGGTDAPVRVQMIVPIKGWIEQPNQSLSLNKAYSFTLDFPEIGPGEEKFGTTMDSWKSGDPDWENVLISIYRRCNTNNNFSNEGWDKDIRENYRHVSGSYE
jgi:hypothetical protein